MTSDTDTNYWSVRHPSLLIRAAMLEVTGYEHNSKGYRDLERVMQRDMFAIEKNMAYQEAAKAKRMRG